MAVELRKLLSRHPQFLMIAFAYSLYLKSAAIIIIDFKACYISLMLRSIPYIPFKSYLRSIFLIENRIKNRLFGKSRRKLLVTAVRDKL